jgi:ABC-type branched-subunit amino acid transport system ATPase component
MSGGLLELRKLRKNFGGVVATNDVSLRFEPGTLSAIIGPNGAGNTTLFHLITGKLPVSGGEVLLDGSAITGLDRTEIVRRGIGRAFQVAHLFPSVVVRDALAAVAIPFVEIHLSNVFARESFRRESYFSDIAVGVISGLGPAGYELAFDYALRHTKKKG